LDLKVAEVVISSMPPLSIMGHPFLVAIIAGITGAFISLIGVIGVHKDSKKMWRSEIFVKKMQAELVSFFDMLSASIKEDYENCNLSKLLNNEFDYESINFKTFFENKLNSSRELEDKFIFIQPVLKKCLKLNEVELIKLFELINTSTLIYKYIWDLIDATNQNYGPSIDDFFDIDYDELLQEQSIIGLLNNQKQEIRNKFKLHCYSAKVKLIEDGKDYGDELKNDILFYRAYLSQIREELNSFKKNISEFMWKEL